MWKSRPTTSHSLKDIAERIGGVLHGDSTRQAKGLCPLDSPTADAITFSRHDHLLPISKHLGNVSIAAILLPNAPSNWKSPSPWNFIVVKDPLRAMLQLVELFFEPIVQPTGIHPQTVIHPSAKVGKNVSIAPFCTVGPDAQIGDFAVLHPGVTLYQGSSVGAYSVLHSGVAIREYCSIGSHCLLHNGVVIGGDGFGFAPDPGKGLIKVPHVGHVVIGNDVEIGANSCVDRATFGITEIGHGTKLDNLVQVGHNARLGRSCLLCAHVAIGGSARIGSGTVLGGHAAVGNQVTVGERARVAAKSGVSQDIGQGDYGGFPAVPARDWRRQVVALKRLPELWRTIRAHDDGRVRDDEEGPNN